MLVNNMNTTNSETIPPMPFVVDLPILYFEESEVQDFATEAAKEKEKSIIPRRKRRRTRNPKPVSKQTQNNRLITQLRKNINELAIQAGQQAVVVLAGTKTKVPTLDIFGSQPLQDIVENMQHTLSAELQSAMIANPNSTNPGLFKLPPLLADGKPTTLRKMNQAQLRAFIPYMMKFSTGRGKPGWGKDSKRPAWWPKEVPYNNVRTDTRPISEKRKKPWTCVLRKIINRCYRYHKREDLLKQRTNRKKPRPYNTKKISVKPIAETTVTEHGVVLVGNDGFEYPVVVSRIVKIPVFDEDSLPSNSNYQSCDSSTHQVLIEGYGKDLPQVLEVTNSYSE